MCDDPRNTSVLIIYTGGTIGMIENAETGALENFNFEQLQKYVPELKQSNCDIDSIQFDPPIDTLKKTSSGWWHMLLKCYVCHMLCMPCALMHPHAI